MTLCFTCIPLGHKSLGFWGVQIFINFLRILISQIIFAIWTKRFDLRMVSITKHQAGKWQLMVFHFLTYRKSSPRRLFEGVAYSNKN